jgi:hypothetical protein
MIRLTLRQHRLQLGSGVVVIAALAALLLWTGHQMTGYLHSSGLSTCLASGAGCDDLSHLFETRYGGLLRNVAWLNFVPMLVGIFWGAPLVAREVEQGTHRLAWTQSISRFRWLATKLAVFLAATAALAAVFSVLFGWWFQPFARVNIGGGFARMDMNVFDFQGIVPIGYAVYAFALGTTGGVVIHRTLPAMAVTLAGYLPVRLEMQSLRAHLFTPLRLVYPPFGTSPRAGRGDWVVHSALVDARGHVLPSDVVFTTCPPAAGGSKTSDVTACLVGHGFHTVDSYQPATRFWALQSVETAVFIGLATLLLAVSVCWTTRRSA